MKILFGLLLFLSFSISAEPTQPSTAMCWPAVTTLVGGDIISAPDIYTIYCGETSGNYTEIQTTTDVRMPYSRFPDGNWFCAATATYNDIESEYSNVINFTSVNGVVPVNAPVPINGFGLCSS